MRSRTPFQHPTQYQSNSRREGARVKFPRLNLMGKYNLKFSRCSRAAKTDLWYFVFRVESLRASGCAGNLG